LLARRPAGWLREIRWRWQDTGHALMIVSALLMAFTRLRGVAWVRHLHHAGLVVYGGFIAGELLSQGLLAGWGAHGTPWRSAPGLLLLAAVALLAPVFSGRQLYCHHLCAHGALQQLLARRLPWQLHLPPAVERWLARLPFALLGLILASVVLGWGIDLNALEPFDAYLFSVAGWASLALAGLGLVAALFTPLAYCRYGCPTGALFKLLRVAGAGDRLGLRDVLAALALAAAALTLAA
jgi:polyferredoxin